MLRKLALTYCRGTIECFQLESELELYTIRHLHELYMGGYPDIDDLDQCNKVNLKFRMYQADKTLYEWKRRGEMREEEEWMIDLLMDIVLHRRSIQDIPAPDDK